MAGKLEVVQTVREALAAWREFFTTLVWVGIVLGLPSSIAEGVAIETDLAAVSAVALALELAAIAVMGGVAAHVVDRAAKGGPSAALRTSAPQIGRFLIGFLVLFVGLVAGFLALVVPGIYLMAAWAVVFPVIALERSGVLQAFKRSWDLSQGSIWRILAVLLISTLIAAAISGILLLLMEGLLSGAIAQVAWGVLTWAIAAPLTGVTAVVLYRRLLAREAELTVPAP